MPVPQAVIFDLGKVLLDFDYTKTVRRIAEHCTTGPEAINQLINQSPLLHDYESGRLTTPEFFAVVQRELGYTQSIENFRASFADIFTEIDPMIDLHTQLRQAGVPTYIFSNTNEIAVDYIGKTFDFFGNFDGYVYSYVEKAMKPETSIYEAVEALTGLTGDQLIYIDDRGENIAAGAARDWQTVHHLSPEESIPAFKAAGLIG